MIPLAGLFIVNLAIAGVFFTKTAPISEESEACELDIPNVGMSHDYASPDYDCDTVGWSRNIAIMSPKKDGPEDTDEQGISEGSNFPDMIDEENTPIFLNAVAGIFFPICHTHAFVENSHTNC